MITIAVCFERIVMALGSGQYNWQDPMRNAGIIAQAEGNNIAAPHDKRRKKIAGYILISFLIIVLFAIIMLFVLGTNSGL